MYNSRVQAASAVGSTRERDTRSDPRRPRRLQYYKTFYTKEGSNQKVIFGAKPSQYYKTYYTEEEIKPKGDICHTTKFQVHKY